MTIKKRSSEMILWSSVVGTHCIIYFSLNSSSCLPNSTAAHYKD